jgi:hypothetical protein
MVLQVLGRINQKGQNWDPKDYGQRERTRMSISPIGQNSPITRLQGSKANGITQGTQDAGRGVTDSDTDTVEISDSARYLSELKNLPDRADKVQSAKDSIAAGTFETPERIDGTVDKLMEAFNSY